MDHSAAPLRSVPPPPTVVPAGSGTRPWLGVSTWAAPRATVTFSVGEVSGVAVVRATGVLDRGALQPCRAALDAGLHTCGAVVLDLDRARGASVMAVALLGATRRYLRVRGADLILAAAPTGLITALDRAHVLPLYCCAPSVGDALNRLLADPADTDRRSEQGC